MFEEKNDNAAAEKGKGKKGKFAGQPDQETGNTNDSGTDKSNLPATQNDEANDLAAMFNFAKKSKGVEITAEYLDLAKLEKGKNEIFIFLGMTTFAGTKGPQPAVLLIDEEKTQYIVASKVIVSALEKIKEEVPVAVGITVNGKIKAAAGEYFDCTVIRY